MKRDENNLTLSRDHHIALLFCWKIRQGLKKQVPADRIRPYVQYFWDNHLDRHFLEEETVLFAGLHDALCEQAIAEHAVIRKLTEEACAADITIAGLHLLADSIDNHIRFEERTLFPHLEQLLQGSPIIAIGERLRQMHETHLPDLYPDEFWV